MNIKRICISFFRVVVMYFYLSQLASAVPISWQLSGVTFDDGGTATGFIKLDFDRIPDPGLGIATIDDFYINISGGNEDIFPAITYVPDNTSQFFFSPIDRPENPQPFFLFALDGPTPFERRRELRISPIFSLDGSSKRVVPLLTGDVAAIGAEECYSCGPFRRITGGAFVVPLPSTFWLLISGFISVLFTQYRRNTNISRIHCT